MKRNVISSILCVSLLALAACHPDEPTPGEPSGQDTTTVNPDSPDQHRNLAYLFDMEAVPEVTVTLTEADWNTYLANFDFDNDNDLYVPAQWTFKKGADVYHRDSVGIRPRGNTSRRRPEGDAGQKHSPTAQWHHAHFGICFTEYESGERFFGCDRVILKWMKDDAAYVREIFSYDMMHRFGVWSAPHASYVRLSMYIEGDPKPVYMGVYSMIENPRKGWLNDRLNEGYIPDKDGNLWKCSWGANLAEPNTGMMGVSDQANALSYQYDLKTNKKKVAAARQELCDFINGLRNHSNGSDELNVWLEQHMDVPLFLRAMAVDVMVGQWDGYWGNNNNFFLYFDSNHRLYFIPFDMDNTLGTGQDSYGNPGTQDPMHWGPLSSERLLMEKVLSIESNRYTFIGYLEEMARDAELMQPAGAIERVKHMQSLIKPYVNNDTGEDCIIEDRPASWGHFHGYRILTGGVGDGQSGEANFFRTKAAAVANISK